jgi:hypothetical protein
VKGINAGSSSSSSSASSLKPILFVNFGGRRKSRDCTGEEDDEEAELEDGESRVSGCGDRWGESVEGILGFVG